MQGRRSSTVTQPVDTHDPRTLDTAAGALDVEVETIERLVVDEWPRRRSAWILLAGIPCAPVALDVEDVVELVEHAGPRLAAVGIDVMLPTGFARRRRTTRQLKVNGRAGGLASRASSSPVRCSSTASRSSDTELDTLLHAPHDLVEVGGSWTYLAAGERARIADFVRSLGDTDAGTVLDVVAEGAADDDTEITIDLPDGSWLRRALSGTWRPVPAEHVAEPDLVRLPFRDYQRDGLDWLVWLETQRARRDPRRRHGPREDRACSRSALRLAATTQPTAPTLVVAPTSVVDNWHARGRAVRARACASRVHHGSGARGPVEHVGEADVVITSYGVLRRDDARCAESTGTAWCSTRRRRSRTRRPRRAGGRAAQRRRTASPLTGTPVENHLGELWSLMTFANPGLLGHASRVQDPLRGRRGDARADAGAARALRAAHRAVRAAPPKTDPGIADELPERIVVRDDCTPRPRAGRRSTRPSSTTCSPTSPTPPACSARGTVLAGHHEAQADLQPPRHARRRRRHERARRSLRQARPARRAGEEIIDEGEAVVVFSQYADVPAPLADAPAHRARPAGAEYLDGSMARPARDKLVDRFSEATVRRCSCVSLKAGGTGLNLVRANHVIHFDRWWNPAVEDQASDRVVADRPDPRRRACTRSCARARSRSASPR